MGLSEEASRDITVAEEELKMRATFLKKVISTLASAKSKIAQKAWPLCDLKKLLVDLNSQTTPATESAIGPLVSSLKKKLDVAGTEFEKAFVTDLSRAAQTNKIACGLASGIRFLGPFELTLDFARESAVLSYAKQPVSGKLPIDATVVAEAALKMAIDLLDARLDLSALAAEFEEAHKVSLVRHHKPIEGRETRSTLPEIFRELQYARQDRSRPLTVESCREYSLARFVVELKTLLQSEANLESRKRFRVETAVIENTKNSKKSIFVPTDLKVGYGEGTYFQALVLVDESR